MTARGAGGAGAGAGAAAAALLLLLLAVLRRRRLPRARRPACQVHIASDAPWRLPRRAPRAPRAPLASEPFEPPQIVVVQNLIQQTLPSPERIDPNLPPDPTVSSQTQQNLPSNPSSSHSSTASTNLTPKYSEFKGIPKLPLPEQWIHKRPFDKYLTVIPRPLAPLANQELMCDPSQDRVKKFSVTRSPSLESDKSPFLLSAKSDKRDVFGFDEAAVKKVSSEIEVPEKDMDEEAMLVPKDEDKQDLSPGNLRRFRSVSTKLNVCCVADSNLDSSQRIEKQHSPKVLECSSAKEKSAMSKFDFSPRLLADSLISPRFYTPPEMVSPMFFTEPSPKSVYYDSVRSPKFFPETPRDIEVPQSPRALADQNRSNGIDKPSSPKILSAKPSPKIHSYNKENYFTFDNVCLNEDGTSRLSPRPKRYGGRNSIEKERFTPPIDKDVRKYRRHNSCDTNVKNIELNISKCDQNKQTEADIEGSKDVLDCCAKIESLKVDSENEKTKELNLSHPNSAQARRQRLKSISLDSDNARIIEQNLGLPIAKQIKDQMNEAYKNQEVSSSCDSIERHPKSPTDLNDREYKELDKWEEEIVKSPKSPDLKKKGLRQSSDTQSFLDKPRFSPKEFEITVTNEDGATTPAESQIKKKGKNLRNLTIDLTKRDCELEKELLEFEKLYTDAEEKKVKTPTLKVKATSLDSSETVNLSLPQNKTLDIPQNSVSVPNTPKRQLQRLLQQKNMKQHEFAGGKLGFNSIQRDAECRRIYLKGQDSGIFLKENHANLMLYQPGSSRVGRTMGSFDENMTDFSENPPEINISSVDNRSYDPGLTLGTNLLNYKPNLSVSSTNLKTLPEGVPSDDFEPSAEDEKIVKKLHRRNSNQMILSTHSLQSSNCSLNSVGTSCHNLSTVRTSMSNFSLNMDGRKRLSLDRKDSNPSIGTEHLIPTTRVVCSSTSNVTGEGTKNCLLQRRGSNNSLTLNIQCTSLSRHSSNSSLNKDAKPATVKKGLLERRSSNTSLTLNINTSNPQLSVVNRGLSISNYNLNGSSCSLSRYNSNQSIDNAASEPKKGILERRASNTSLTLNIQPQEPRDIEIDENTLETNLKDLPHRDKHRKSLSTENLIPKSYKNRLKLKTADNKCVGFGSHDNLWSTSYTTEQECPQNLTYVCGDHDNEIIYAFGRQDDQNFQQSFVRNITTKPLSPQSTSEDFRLYLANMQHLQNASSVLSRQQLKDLNEVFENGYSKVKCPASEDQGCCCGKAPATDLSKNNPQMTIPDITQPCSEYQKMMLRNLHQEFWDMPTNFQEKPIVSGSHSKNRYKTILPNEHSRFLLRGDTGPASEGYINANFIKGHEYTKNCYIATQGPLQNTIYDFWLMVYQNNLDFQAQQAAKGNQDQVGVQKVVMLTNFIENNRQKCEKYFPLDIHEVLSFKSSEYTESNTFFGDEDVFYNKFVITNVGMVHKSGYTIRKLNVKYEKKIVRDRSEECAEITVYHYWFHNWADHKCPKDVNALLNLSLDVLKDTVIDFKVSEEVSVSSEQCQCESAAASKLVFPLEEPGRPPPVVHCSAGVGRTGCLLAALAGLRQLARESRADVLATVCQLRLHRGGMVQTSEQYELVHRLLCLYERACLPAL